MTELAVTVFERKIGVRLVWTTVGLGRLDRQERGTHAGKLRSKLIGHLRLAITRLWPAELEELELVPGRRLEYVTIEIAIDDGRTQVRGKIPIVLEPRSRGAIEGDDGEPLWIAYHPLRSDEWFAHDPQRELAAEASAYFRTCWAALDGAAFDELRCAPRGRERLLLVAFSVRCRSVFDHLDKREERERFSLLGDSQGKRGAALLAELGTDQTERAADDRLPATAPRSPWREQLQQLLCGERKTSVLLVGASGVGKSALLQRMIHDLLAADGFDAHRNLDRAHAVWQIRGSRIIAGMSYLGQWEQRCVDLLDACREQRAILWVDDLHAWGRIGESREADRSLATFFRGPIARGELTIVAECSAEQLQLLQDDAPAFAAAFTILWVEPTDAASTQRLVLDCARALELEHDVAFDPRTFRALTELGLALTSGAVEPGRSIALLRDLVRGRSDALVFAGVERELGRGNKIAAIKRYREITGAGLRDSKDAVERFAAEGRWTRTHVRDRPRPAPRGLLDMRFDDDTGELRVGPDAIIRLLAARTGVPAALLVPDTRLAADAIEGAFAAQIVGQRAGVAAVTDLVVRMRTQLADAGRPYGVLLLSGPTGTGKTEIAKCLAEYLYGDAQRLIRLDMSEYAGPGAPARLLGDRMRPEGTLTTSVRAQPFSVVLLDEIDKADASVLALMLQLFDDGRLTDASGQTVDFSHTVVLMTSNLGAARAPAVGFGDAPVASRVEVDAAVRQFFPPELFNRIDRIVPFAALTHEVARGIAERELTRLLGRAGLVERNVFVRHSPAVVELVVRHGFAQRDGARSLKRWLEDSIGAWLADAIAAARASALRVFWLFVRDGRLELHAEHLREATVRGRPGPLAALLGRGARELRHEIPGALARVEALLASGELARLATTLAGLLRPSITGDSAAGQLAFDIDTIRGELDALRERLALQRSYDPMLEPDDERIEDELREVDLAGRAEKPGSGDAVYARGRLRVLDARAMIPTLPLRTADDVIAQLAELRLLERALCHADDPDEHTVLIELTRISRSRAGRFAQAEPGLLEWLIDAYAGGRGMVESMAIADADASPRPVAWVGPLARAVTTAALRVAGPGIRTFLAGEHGCHVRHAMSGSTEVVRVRVYPGHALAPVEHLARVGEARRAFLAALESGARELPDNPDAVPPIVRTYHFDGPSTDVAVPITVDDHALGATLHRNVHGLGQVLPTLWMLALDREEAPT